MRLSVNLFLIDRVRTYWVRIRAESAGETAYPRDGHGSTGIFRPRRRDLLSEHRAVRPGERCVQVGRIRDIDFTAERRGRARTQSATGRLGEKGRGAGAGARVGL